MQMDYSEASAEYRAIVQVYCKLRTGIRSGLDSALDDAWSEGLICENVRARCLNASESEKTNHFLEALKDRICTDASAFDKFLEILKREPAHVHLAKMLEDRRDAERMKAETLTSTISEHSRHVDLLRGGPLAQFRPQQSSITDYSLPRHAAAPKLFHSKAETPRSTGITAIDAPSRYPYNANIKPPPPYKAAATPQPSEIDRRQRETHESPPTDITSCDEESSSGVEIHTHAPTPTHPPPLAQPEVESGTLSVRCVDIERSFSTSSQTSDYQTPPSTPGLKEINPIQETEEPDYSTVRTPTSGSFVAHETSKKCQELEEKLSNALSQLSQLKLREHEYKDNKDKLEIKNTQLQSENHHVWSKNTKLEKDLQERDILLQQTQAEVDKLSQDCQMLQMQYQQKVRELLDAKSYGFDVMRRRDELEQEVKSLLSRLDQLQFAPYT